MRLLYIDLAKGFTVLFIPAIHCFMIYANPAVYSSGLAIFLAFIAEWAGAQVLMFLMGFTMSSTIKSTSQLLIRSITLFTAGIVLNFLKFLLPYYCDLLPENFLQHLQFSHQHPVSLNLFLVGDIMQFAAISIAFLAFLKKFNHSTFLSLLIIYTVVLLSPFVWDLHHNNILLDYILHLATGAPDDCFFPLFPWMIYPLAGYAIGSYLASPYAKSIAVFLSGLILFSTGYLIQFFGFGSEMVSFWRTTPEFTIMHLGFVMLWFTLWKWIAISFPGFNLLCNLLQFCARNITSIYFSQWIIIFWLIPVFGFHNLSHYETIYAILIVYALVFSLLILTNSKNKKQACKSRLTKAQQQFYSSIPSSLR